LARWKDYQYLIINADLDKAEEDLAAIVRTHRLRIGAA
jgi:guanylate kinase